MAVCAVGSLIYSRLPNRVTSAELDRLQRGMPREQVRQILGEPDRIFHSPKLNTEAWTYVDVGVLFDRNGNFTEWHN